MSMHVEWGSAPGSMVLLTKEEATDQLHPDVEIGTDYVLVVGGGGGGCAAIEGSLYHLGEDLTAMRKQVAGLLVTDPTEPTPPVGPTPIPTPRRLLSELSHEELVEIVHRLRGYGEDYEHDPMRPAWMLASQVKRCIGRYLGEPRPS